MPAAISEVPLANASCSALVLMRFPPPLSPAGCCSPKSKSDLGEQMGEETQNHRLKSSYTGKLSTARKLIEALSRKTEFGLRITEPKSRPGPTLRNGGEILLTPWKRGKKRKTPVGNFPPGLVFTEFDLGFARLERIAFAISALHELVRVRRVLRGECDGIPLDLFAWLVFFLGHPHGQVSEQDRLGKWSRVVGEV